MKIRIALITLLFIILFAPAQAQKYEIMVKNEPLNKVLIGLRDKYGLQFSFNDDHLSDFNITLTKEFSSTDKIMLSLLKGLPLAYKRVNQVYLIYPFKKPKKHRIWGHIIDATSREPLPYSHLLINGIGTTSDEMGNFTYTSSSDSLFHIISSHLGYFIQDTSLSAGSLKTIMLYPAKIALPEITVHQPKAQNFIQKGKQAGNIALNPNIAGFLPSNDDNTVFNLLRLQPGILASGEQTSDLMIWGSYQGESQLTLDGFTLWGLNGFNEEIGAVNPLVVKNIEVYKGGYDVRYGDRVGGIAQITGKSGNLEKPTLDLSLNNITASGCYTQPLGNNSSLLLAFRHTYYNIYRDDKEKITSSSGSGVGSATPQQQRIDVSPHYRFQDANIKFTTHSPNGNRFQMSFLAGDDQFSYSIHPNGNTRLNREKKEDNKQYGGSLFWDRSWKNGSHSKITLATSELKSTTNNIIWITNLRTQKVHLRQNDEIQNKIREVKATAKHTISFPKNQIMETGLFYTHNDVELVEDSLNINVSNISTTSPRIGYYINHRIDILNHIKAKIGIRSTLPWMLHHLFWEPRLNLSYENKKGLSISASWGLYKQFISRSSVIDENGNYHYIWTANNNTTRPVISSSHFVSGISLHKKQITLSVEGYYKNTQGHTRYYQFRKEDYISKGESRSYGLDFYAQKNIGKHSLWLAYSLSKTEERFDYFKTQEYRRAMQDQRHELKVAGLVNMHPFYLSANYIYGSGFPVYNHRQGTVYAEPDYNRMDASLMYHLKIRKVRSEMGVQLQNILNQDNIKYNSFETIPINQYNTVFINTDPIGRALRLYLRVTLN